MDLIIKLLTVLGLGIIALWGAIPAGLALKLHPVATAITAAIGAIFSAMLVVLLGDHVKSYLMRHHRRKDKKIEHSRIYRIWQLYGIIGLGLSAPLLTGAPLGTALGLALGTEPRRLLFWISIGIILWSMILTIIGVLGVSGIKAVMY